jgi:hypothetical protein
MLPKNTRGALKLHSKPIMTCLWHYKKPRLNKINNGVPRFSKALKKKKKKKKKPILFILFQLNVKNEQSTKRV